MKLTPPQTTICSGPRKIIWDASTVTCNKLITQDLQGWKPVQQKVDFTILAKTPFIGP